MRTAYVCIDSSGLAMQMIGNSRPASCAEHQVTHLWDMEVINGPLDALHGEKVSVAALLVLEEYKRIAAAITQEDVTQNPMRMRTRSF